MPKHKTIVMGLFERPNFWYYLGSQSERQNQSIKTRALKFYIPYIQQAVSPLPLPLLFSILVLAVFNILVLSFRRHGPARFLTDGVSNLDPL